ncbi:hypothetical protein DL546_005310 [Coniochaeta pulveracea]|uniref:Uncharacterized protein n=1 Tax=Coniochaeta pulveracea TaxID=177199 RepID=A0A420Y2N9_9PEZI|nr:hypothetical protein DL546_005310 [Coniochaeta pulveracea]
MGSLCSKQEPSAFAQPGRRLDQASPRPAAPTASIPTAGKPKVGGPPRTLGGSSPPGSGGDANDARRRAAEAAEARNNPKGSGGKLSAQLAADKKKTQAQTLSEAAYANNRHRDADEAAAARLHA